MNDKYIKAQIKSLERNSAHLYDMGHSFWHCAAIDNDKNKSFYYVSINRTRHMSTCSNCEQIMNNNRLIIHLKKQLN